MSDFCPDTSGQWWTLFLGSLVQLCCGEGEMLQTNTTGVCSQCLSRTGPAPAHGACALPAHTAQALRCSTRNRLRPALSCMHLPGLSRSGSGTQEVLRGADLVGPAFCALPKSKWHPTPVFLPGESHGQRSLVGYSPRGRKESDTTERLHFHFQV